MPVQCIPLLYQLTTVLILSSRSDQGMRDSAFYIVIQIADILRVRQVSGAAYRTS